MKRLIPSSLTTFLNANPTCIKADLFVLNLPNGQTMNVTEGQFDIKVPSGTNGWGGSTTTFFASEYGKWFRGPITSEAGFSLAANSMSLTCVVQSGTQYPGLACGILFGAWNGLFDATPVSVYTAYMPLGNYGNVSAGIETKWVGFIDKPSTVERTHVVFDCQDPPYLLNQKVPAKIMQTGCPWGFCDPNCTLTASDYTVTFTAKTGSTQLLLTPTSAFSQATGYFSQGVVTCTAGGNKGLGMTVKLHDSSGNLELQAPFILPVTAGDTFSVIKGCDKSVTMCSATIKAGGSSVNNLVHHGGYATIPQPIEAA